MAAKECCPACGNEIRQGKWTQFQRVEGVTICDGCWKLPWGLLLHACEGQKKRPREIPKALVESLDAAIRAFSKVLWSKAYPLIFPTKGRRGFGMPKKISAITTYAPAKYAPSKSHLKGRPAWDDRGYMSGFTYTEENCKGQPMKLKRPIGRPVAKILGSGIKRNTKPTKAKKARK